MSEGTAGNGVYVYGVVAAGARIPGDLDPVGAPGGEIGLLDHRELAAVVSDVPTDRPLGRRDDLMAHERVVNAVAAEVTVLPMQFGGVVSDDLAVVDELLEENHDFFVDVLRRLDGCLQFVLYGRYDEDLLLGGIVDRDPEIAEMSRSLRDTDPDATHYERITLGERIANEVERLRTADAEAAVELLEPQCEGIVVKEVGGEDGAVHLAVLVRRDRRAEFDTAVDALGDEWGDRVSLQLIGPVAPFDFLPAPDAGTEE
ncbi:putative gas vesicle synthesis protein [Pseudonocardia sp. Ae168_Ps1]|uniref:GvpL/GvpF family gas vesicle protein n=1 Tax=unclassified Pseudonocardia TaxID=2619320 RepID=UPI0001FFF1C7|nr:MULTISPECIES: GvpL/GvpF family gas vesicle protein [unclassified Pseudonocardia]OLL71155.1 putative gas vesicle synthesis protein [Pseudonocardia sp. Ae168_Ps1]OLL77296.1 putative gas vesicle synthesis protein [Pseudonocardia sp. Ae150A_Ps1]OLL88594.1 putative gas vesicle synthesis protein [Pseudonocardia sp. Ae263_Ps1]OLL91385.1 putative gas vesicle synthesis protein [Pseudonocardia sp. Ae356_Ps1]OLM17877.1 putative gas vesicle synthesis protein [Pseudonocardia sp. Ae707_Ps1]